MRAIDWKMWTYMSHLIFPKYKLERRSSMPTRLLYHGLALLAINTFGHDMKKERSYLKFNKIDFICVVRTATQNDFSFELKK